MLIDMEKIKLEDLVSEKIFGIPKYHVESGNGTHVQMINIRNLQDGTVVPEPIENCVVKESWDVDESRVARGDVLISIKGSSFKAAVIDNETTGLTISPNLFGIRLNGRLHPEILVAYLNSSDGQKELMKLARGTVVNALSISNLLRLSVPVPPVQTQEVLRVYLGAVREYTKLTRKETTLIEKITATILQENLR